MPTGANHNQVVAIGIDSANLGLLRRWARDGHLPNIAALLERSAHAVNDCGRLAVEVPWSTFVSGCRPETTGYWSALSYSTAYDTAEVPLYGFDDIRPFYAYAQGRRCIIFDVPQAPVCPEVEGVQVLGWGDHFIQGGSGSHPDGLLESITQRYGPHPAFANDFMTVGQDLDKSIEERLLTGLERRTRVLLDLMDDESADFVLVVLSEMHSAGHAFWHMSQPDHPAYAHARPDDGTDPLLLIYEAADRTVGRIVEAADDDACIVLFSVHGIEANAADLASLLFLPELLYRHAFDGRAALSPGTAGAAIPPVTVEPHRSWDNVVWRTQRDANPLRHAVRQHAIARASYLLDRTIGSPHGLVHPCATTPGQPPLWYRPYWPDMEAFALPSFSDGRIRINVKGREADGRVEPADFDRVCADVTALVRDLRDARTGTPLAREILRTRARPSASPDGRPDPDLIVFWNQPPADVADSSTLGRIGPVPFRRAGAHTAEGFFAIAGPGVPPAELPPGDLVDLAPTLLELLGASIPDHLDGRSRLRDMIPATAAR